MAAIFLFVLGIVLGRVAATRAARRAARVTRVFATFLLRHASLRTARRLTRQALWDEKFMGGAT